jgi:hypothetical protein
VALIDIITSFTCDNFVGLIVYRLERGYISPISLAPPISGMNELSSVVSLPEGDCPITTSQQSPNRTHFQFAGN